MVLTLRKTSQRLKILEYLRSVRIHPTAEDVHEHVKGSLPAISLATVYRNLNLLVREGKVRKIEVGGEYHFDADLSLHQHTVCRICGRIDDIHGRVLRPKALDGFNVEQIDIIYRGVCSKCADAL